MSDHRYGDYGRSRRDHGSIFSDEDRSRGWRGDDRWSRDRVSGDHEDDRGFFDRAGDEVRSWFGDEEAERRREMDARREEMMGRDQGARSSGDWGGRDPDRYQGGESYRDRQPGQAYRSNQAERSRYDRSPGGYAGYTGPSGREGGNRGYGSTYGAYGSSERSYGGDAESRGGYGQSFDRPSGFSDRDSMERSRRAGGGSGGRGSQWDESYLRWREQQIARLDQEYDEYCRDCDQRFGQDFQSWRSSRLTEGGMSGQYGGAPSAGDQNAGQSGDQNGGQSSSLTGTGTSTDPGATSGGGGLGSAATSSTGSSGIPATGGSNSADATTTSSAGESGRSRTSRSRS